MESQCCHRRETGSDPCYFTCTLSQAARWKEQSRAPAFETVLGLIDEQARLVPDLPAFGIAATDGPCAAPLTFAQLQALSQGSVDALRCSLATLGGPDGQDPSPGGVVGLLSSSDVSFVATWLGLMRLGRTVFFLAPQLDATAIDHLAATSGIKAVFADARQLGKANQLTAPNIGVFPVPSAPDQINNSGDAPRHPPPITGCEGGDDVAFLMHTSGTSSGLPQPIIQTHHGAVGVLPRLNIPHPSRPSPPPAVATFTTTPLYHGGIADCFRAWSSGAPVWLFPEAEAPVTASNVVAAVQNCSHHSPAGAYFSSVPYVLQLLSDAPDGIAALKTMALVGVGGAALPDSVGDRLVGEHGVRLVSRMGSAECGFLLSSADRDFASDKAWQYLRLGGEEKESDGDQKAPMLAMESRPGFFPGAAELVVKPRWPLRLKVNGEDGSYATSDLFEPHGSIQNAWRYHSRSDSQITLLTGKKFDPAPIEADIVAGCDSRLAVKDVLVFGSGKEAPGALVFPSSCGDGEEEKRGVEQEVRKVMERLGDKWPRHASLARSALVVVPRADWGGAQPLQKSSKGTVMRKPAEERYARFIQSAYNDQRADNGHEKVWSDDELPGAIRDAVTEVLGRPVETDNDLFQQGVDSVACIQLRDMLRSRFLSGRGRDLPLSIIYDCGTVDALVSYIRVSRSDRGPESGRTNGEEGDKNDEARRQQEAMRQLAAKYSQRAPSRSQGRAGDEPSHQAESPPAAIGRGGEEKGHEDVVVVLTGATGALGSHVLHQLLNNTKVRRVLCLVRDQDPAQAHERVTEASTSRRLFRSAAQDAKVECIPYDMFADDEALEAPTRDLGLSIRKASSSSPEAAVVFIHAAWSVNFTLSLTSFERLVASTASLLNLCLSIQQQASSFHFISSTAAVASSSAAKAAPVQEVESIDPADASPLGYSRSKWVAERVVSAAGGAIGGKGISIMRVGQLCGDESTGIWNMSEAYPLMLSAGNIMGCLPELDTPLDWLPVDRAASAVLDIAVPRAEGASRPTESHGGCPVYHISNPHPYPLWSDMLGSIVAYEKAATGRQIERARGPEWIARLEKALATETIPPGHQSRNLFEFWKGMFARGDSPGEEMEKAPRFDVSRAGGASSTIKSVDPLSQDLILRMWRWIQSRAT